jgi:hypothetical protein
MPKVVGSVDIQAICPCGKSRMEKTDAKMKNWIRLHKKYCKQFGDVTNADMTYKMVKAETGEQFGTPIRVFSPEEAQKMLKKYNPNSITIFPEN